MYLGNGKQPTNVPRPFDFYFRSIGEKGFDSETGSFRTPKQTGLLTRWGLLNRERESLEPIWTRNCKSVRSHNRTLALSEIPTSQKRKRPS